MCSTMPSAINQNLDIPPPPVPLAEASGGEFRSLARLLREEDQRTPASIQA